jgi:hypothetical protein
VPAALTLGVQNAQICADEIHQLDLSQFMHIVGSSRRCGLVHSRRSGQGPIHALPSGSLALRRQPADWSMITAQPLGAVRFRTCRWQE